MGGITSHSQNPHEQLSGRVYGSRGQIKNMSHSLHATRRVEPENHELKGKSYRYKYAQRIET